MIDIKKQSYTVTETAAIIGVRRETIHRWINNGDVKTVCIGGGFQRIPEKEIKRMLGEE
jgi:excisionase family DNA binding protein